MLKTGSINLVKKKKPKHKTMHKDGWDGGELQGKKIKDDRTQRGVELGTIEKSECCWAPVQLYWCASGLLFSYHSYATQGLHCSQWAGSSHSNH